MLSAVTGTAMRWLRSQVAQVQTTASRSTRPPATEPASEPATATATREMLRRRQAPANRT